MSYQKTINPAYETIGRRKKLTGYLAELHDGNILLHSQEYSTNSQAEQALDTIVYDLLTDLNEHGLVDDVPAALEAEQVSSTHLPSWQPAPSLYALVVAECQTELDARMARASCSECGDPMDLSGTGLCHLCRDWSEPVVMVPNVDLDVPGGVDLYATAFELDDHPDLIAEAGILINTLEEMQFDLCADYEAEGRFPPSVMAHHNRLCRILAKAERRLQRREFTELGGMDFTPPNVEYAPFGFAA